jgi:RNA polymerase sigma-70 factor (ECF subfamily)
MNIGELHRREYGHILASLIRSVRDISLAEDALQEAFAAAVEQWPSQGLPSNPVAWLMRTARNKAVDQIRRTVFVEQKREEIAAAIAPAEDAPVPLDSLRLIVTCCHPTLAPEAQIALTLRTVGGLSTEEIARAFVVPLATMAQRIVRAKNRIKLAKIPYEVPADDELPKRLDAALTVIYLIFNEGYAASFGDDIVRADLCVEAIRLGREIVALLPDETEARALLALMLLNDARRATRADAHGDIVLLEDQDRSQWDREKIEEGVSLVEQALRDGQPGHYAIQAAIAALHAEAPSVALTDWEQIAALYDLLLSMTPSPIIELNRAVAIAMARGFETGLALLEHIDLPGYHLLPAARADMHRRLGHAAEAAAEYRRALALVTNEAERRFLERRLAELP